MLAVRKTGHFLVDLGAIWAYGPVVEARWRGAGGAEAKYGGGWGGAMAGWTTYALKQAKVQALSMRQADATIELGSPRLSRVMRHMSWDMPVRRPKR